MQQNLSATPLAAAWNRIGFRQHHGIVLPLFSIRTQNSGGIGEYLDLLPLIDWCAEVGFEIIQLLPLNDTGHETSPYSSLTAHALNSVHLSLHELPGLPSHPDLKEILRNLSTYNETPKVDYETVRELKEIFLEKYFFVERKNLLQEAALKSFREKNPWLHSYALFKTLKKKYHWQPASSWPKIDLDDLRDNENVENEILIQFLCFQQMKHIKEYASHKKVLIKGDIPILINTDSCDVWAHPDLFNLDLRAGAPPDYYSHDGQNWDCPLYRIEEKREEVFAWWSERLQTASPLYDLYRLDHIVGFYRIWGVPPGKLGKEGKYVPADPSTWRSNGEEILRAIMIKTPMLPIGEDLGTVPPIVRESMKSLGICGTKVMRWERNWEGDKSYIELADYEPLSMTTLSTHDSESLAEWWKKIPEESKLFAEMLRIPWEPSLGHENRQAVLKASHATSSLFHINPLQEYLALVPELAWSSPEEDRINIPGLVLQDNWRFRFRCSLEEMISSSGLKEEIKYAIGERPR